VGGTVVVKALWKLYMLAETPNKYLSVGFFEFSQLTSGVLYNSGTAMWLLRVRSYK
jgi:hypothetical protein